MTTVKIAGTIMPSDQSLVYDFLGIENTTPAKVSEQLNDANGSDVDVVINSGGGDVFAGSEIYSSLKAYEGNVNVKIYGMAASAASVIAMAGTKVSISPTAQIMIHNVSSVSQGDYRDMDKMSSILKQSNSALANSYVDKTGKSKEEILKLMNNETWLDADTALEQGFADEILFVDSETPAMSNSLAPMISADAMNKILNLINEDKKKDKSKTDTQSGDSKDKDKSGSDDDKEKSGSGDGKDKEKDKDKNTDSDTDKDTDKGSDTGDKEDDPESEGKGKDKKKQKKNLAEIELTNRIRIMEMEGQINE